MYRIVKMRKTGINAIKGITHVLHLTLQNPWSISKCGYTIVVYTILIICEFCKFVTFLYAMKLLLFHQIDDNCSCACQL